MDLSFIHQQERDRTMNNYDVGSRGAVRRKVPPSTSNSYNSHTSEQQHLEILVMSFGKQLWQFPTVYFH